MGVCVYGGELRERKVVVVDVWMCVCVYGRVVGVLVKEGLMSSEEREDRNETLWPRHSSSSLLCSLDRPCYSKHTHTHADTHTHTHVAHKHHLTGT